MAELIPVALKEIVNEKFTCKPGDPIPVKFSAKWVIKFLKEKYGEDAIGYKDSAGLVRESLSQQGSEKLASLEARIDLLTEAVQEIKSLLTKPQAEPKRRGRPKVRSGNVTGEVKENVDAQA